MTLHLIIETVVIVSNQAYKHHKSESMSFIASDCSCAPVSCKNEQKQHENNLVLKVVNTIKNTVLHGTFTLCVVSSTAHPSSFQGEYSCKIHNVKKSTPVVSYLTALQNMTGQILLCNYAFFFVLLSWWYIIFLIKMYLVSKL